MWACDWKRFLSKNKEAANIINSKYAITPPIKPRSALVGGRTEIFRAHVNTASRKNSRILLLDCVSKLKFIAINI
jgi:hypothetical protein